MDMLPNLITFFISFINNKNKIIVIFTRIKTNFKKLIFIIMKQRNEMIQVWINHFSVD